MIGWLLPAALAGLAFALGPLAIHLLRRRQSQRTIVPTVRFVTAVSQSSLRVHAPDDLLLLLLRTAAIVAAVIALASPIFITPARRLAWDARTVRAVVVDTSPSASAPGNAESIESELRAASVSRRIDSDHVAEGVRRAVAWLSTTPPGRREVVVISDFQHGSVSSQEIDAVPSGVGLRFVRSAGTRAPDRIDGGHELLDGRAADRSVTLDGWATALTLSDRSTASPNLRIEGTTAEEAARLERIVRAGGVAWPRTAGATVVRFGVAAPASPDGSAVGSAARPALRLLQDPTVAGIAFTASADRGTLVVSTAIAPASYDAAVLVQTALRSWRDPDADAEAEVQSLSDATLQAWTRSPGPADTSIWRQAERSDARWFWLASLLCLAGEAWARGRHAVTEGSHARAA